jgi:Putative regulator of cell autolysis
MKKQPYLSIYIRCQLIGWSLAALYWGFEGYHPQNYDFEIGAIQFITDVSFYILITHIYRLFALKHQWQNLGLSELLQKFLPSILVLATLYTLITTTKIYFINTWFFSSTESFQIFFREHGLGIFMAGLRLMSIWLLAYHLYHYAQRELRLSRENSRLAELNKETKLNQLASHLNPHFFFNSLNSIKCLVIENPQAARRSIDLLSDLLRTSLNHKEQGLISVSDELGMVMDYLELEKIRLEERLQFQINAPAVLRDSFIPPLSIQTLVENAIKHGITKYPTGGQVLINIEKVEDQIKTTVQNPGILSMRCKKEGLGLKLLRERLELFYSKNAHLTLTQEKHFVKATLITPL